MEAEINFNLPDPVAIKDRLEQMRKEAAPLIKEMNLRILLHGAYAKTLGEPHGLLCSTYHMLEAVRETVRAVTGTELKYENWQSTSFDTYWIADNILTTAQAEGAFPQGAKPWEYIIAHLSSIKTNCASIAGGHDVLILEENVFEKASGRLKELGWENVRKYKEVRKELNALQAQAKYLITVGKINQQDYPWTKLTYQ
jgi:hypothetical protein